MLDRGEWSLLPRVEAMSHSEYLQVMSLEHGGNLPTRKTTVGDAARPGERARPRPCSKRVLASPLEFLCRDTLVRGRCVGRLPSQRDIENMSR